MKISEAIEQLKTLLEHCGDVELVVEKKSTQSGLVNVFESAKFDHVHPAGIEGVTVVYVTNDTEPLV